MPKASVNYALAATLIASGMTYDDAAMECGAKNGQGLRVGLFRKGVTRKQALAPRDHLPVNRSVTLRVATEASEVLKRSMAEILQNHTGALAAVKAKSNLKHITQVGNALEPLVRSAKVVHGWGDSDKAGLVVIGAVRQSDPDAQPVIDVTTVAESSTPDTTSVTDCGAVDTTGGGAQATPSESTPQSE